MRWHLLSNGVFFYDLYKNASTSIKLHKDQRYRNKHIEPNGTKIAVIRNPLDRLVSAYEHLYHEYRDFAAVVDHVANNPDSILNPHFRAQSPQLVPFPDKLILFENVNEEFAKMGLILERVNWSKRSNWQSYYDEEMEKRVRERYSDDVELYEGLGGVISSVSDDPGGPD